MYISRLLISNTDTYILVGSGWIIVSKNESNPLLLTILLTLSSLPNRGLILSAVGRLFHNHELLDKVQEMCVTADAWPTITSLCASHPRPARAYQPYIEWTHSIRTISNILLEMCIYHYNQKPLRLCEFTQVAPTLFDALSYCAEIKAPWKKGLNLA